MSRIYDNWEKLVGAVVRREKDRQLVYCESFNTSSSADLSLDPHLQDEGVEFSRSSSQNIFFSPNVVTIEYKVIKKATRNFRHNMMFGEGRSGRVYKGWIDEHYLSAVKPGSGIAVAVKKLNIKGYQAHEEWVDEINSSGHRHPNLVTLIGYSFESDRDDRFLVYELMPRGSLANQLFRRGRESLPWATRIKVALDVGRGLAFLHALEIPAMHRNVKSSKIFLDGDFNAKLRYFDSKLPEYEQPITEIRPFPISENDAAYADPMYLISGRYSSESDVYSFGVVLVELISGLRAFDECRSSDKRFLMYWIKLYMVDGKKMSLIMDSRLKGQYPPIQAHKIAQIAMQCVSSSPRLRPRMADVVAALEKLQYTS